MSNLPYEDFLFVLFAIMLEVHVVISSKNITLLTATM